MRLNSEQFFHGIAAVLPLRPPGVSECELPIDPECDPKTALDIFHKVISGLQGRFQVNSVKGIQPSPVIDNKAFVASLPFNSKTDKGVSLGLYCATDDSQSSFSYILRIAVMVSADDFAGWGGVLTPAQEYRSFLQIVLDEMYNLFLSNGFIFYKDPDGKVRLQFNPTEATLF